MAEFTLKPIGYFKGSHLNKSAVPRQGYLSQQKGYIQFEKGFDAQSALKGLEKMSHLWLIFSFHQNENHPVKPLVRPPRKPEIQVGIWASRSPYRPNHLGLTLASIEKIKDSKLYLTHVDLLDGTPIFDIKPYVTESDCPQNPQLGWIDQIEKWKYFPSPYFAEQTQWLSENGVSEIQDVLESQFGTPPLQFKRKRIAPFSESQLAFPNLRKVSQENLYVLSYRTWRILARIESDKKRSYLLRLTTGYSPAELLSDKDPFQDKKFHRLFIEKFF